MSVQATPLSPHCEEFLRLEYLLQLALRSTAIKELQAWVIGNPHLTVQYERRSSGLLSVDSWVDSEQLDERNPIQEVCKRGYVFPDSQKGMVFSTGCVKNVETGAHQMILSKVAVGRSYVVESDADMSKRVVPPGYDSLYIHRNSSQDTPAVEEEEDDEFEPSPSEYYHEYVLTDPAQVLPLYIVHFSFTPEESHGVAPLCDMCSRAPAIIYCENDAANLCEECDHEIHSANALSARHQRRPLDDMKFAGSGLRQTLSALRERVGNKLSFKSSCPYHPGMTVEFWCPVCQVPVCVHCKMVGHHCSGEAASHTLISISDAYASALDSSQMEDPMVEERVEWIRTHLARIDGKLREVNSNSAAIEETIYQKLQDALFQLQDETQRKVAVLLAEELELRRQLEQIEWVESYLKAQQDALTPVRFLASWGRHAQLRSEILSQQRMQPRAINEVFADIRLTGEVRVVTDAVGQKTASAAVPPKEAELGTLPTPLSPQNISSGGGLVRATEMWSSHVRDNLGIQQNKKEPLPVENDAPEEEEEPEEPFRPPVEEVYVQRPQPSSGGRALAERAMRGFESCLKRHSLREHAEREQKSREGVVDGSVNYALNFSGSRLLTGENAMWVFLTIPLIPPKMSSYGGMPTGSPEPADTKLLWASYPMEGGEATGIRAFTSFFQMNFIQCATMVLIRSGDNVFGGYCSMPWRFDGQGFGSTDCFLFSSTKDVYLPYQGRGGALLNDFACANDETLQFGMKDLIIKGDLTDCKTELENSYGVGAPKPIPREAKHLLTGSGSFNVDAIEIWAIGRREDLEQIPDGMSG